MVNCLKVQVYLCMFSFSINPYLLRCHYQSEPKIHLLNVFTDSKQVNREPLSCQLLLVTLNAHLCVNWLVLDATGPPGSRLQKGQTQTAECAATLRLNCAVTMTEQSNGL